MSATAHRLALTIGPDHSAYRAFLDSLPFLMSLTDPFGSCIFENRAALSFTGCKLDDVLGNGWKRHVHPEDAMRISRERIVPCASQSQWQTELRHRRADGEYRWFLATMVPLLDPRGFFSGYLACCADIHEQKAAAESLRILAAQLEGRVQERTFQLANSDEHRNRAAELARANQALKQTLDILATEIEIDRVLGHVLSVITQYLGGSGSTLWLKARETETISLHLLYRDGRLLPGAESGHRLAGESVDLGRQDLFALAVFRLGRPVWHEIDSSPALDDVGRAYLKDQGVQGLLGVPLVLGEKTIGAIVVRFPQLREFGSVELEMAQGLAQQATLALQLTLLADQARKSAITEERNRMAREIHDTLAQGFTGILVQLQAAKQVLNGSHPDVKPHLDSATSLARAGLAEARRSVQGLRPQLLRGGDISSAVKRLIRQLSGESLMKISLSVAGESQPISSDVETNLLRIAQEALTNAMKHSGGNQVSVKLDLAGDVIKLMIEDNGDGFDPHVSTLSRGFGLISMQERADRIGADLTILTKPGAGTKLHLLMQLAQPKKSGASHS
jgi:PAS domain S-box-containing protein